MIKINDEVCSDIADFFKIFGDAGRIKILCALVDPPFFYYKNFTGKSK